MNRARPVRRCMDCGEHMTEVEWVRWRGRCKDCQVKKHSSIKADEKVEGGI